MHKPETLKSLIRKADMSQKDVAEALGFAPSTISYWVTGHKKVADKYIPLLAQVLCVPKRRVQAALANQRIDA